MNFAKTHSGQSYCLQGQVIDIEVDLSRGLHSFSIVGLPDKAVEEARDRISAAIKNSGYVSPKQKNHRVVISLAPAHVRKEGSHFDLAMALGYLQASGDIHFNPTGRMFVGELSLNGAVRKVHGVLSIVLEARKKGFKEIFIPTENVGEIRLVTNISIHAVSHLKEVIEIVTENKKTKQWECQTHIVPEKVQQANVPEIFLEEIVGQHFAKRGLEIAAAGGHNVLMWGPPGTGKTMLAHAMQKLLPKLSDQEALEVTSIHSSLGLTSDLIFDPPFRAPHHTTSYSALIGGGSIPRPGEITLAHRGVLFLDEFSEFDRNVIETLRQPIEAREIKITRAKTSVSFPAHFILIAAMNPCPCGFNLSQKKLCVCSAAEISNYKKKISGPILDRIDLSISVDHVSYTDVQKNSLHKDPQRAHTLEKAETALAIKRILRARELQQERHSSHDNNPAYTTRLNSSTNGNDLARTSNINSQATKILLDGAEAFNLSMRAYHRVWRVARTIADLDDSPEITERHVLEAFQYRKNEN